MHYGECANCRRRSDELHVVTDQLRSARAEAAELEDLLREAEATITAVRTTLEASLPAPPLHPSRAKELDIIADAAEDSDVPWRSDTITQRSLRATGSFPFRYVPPVDFLPAEFVDAYSDVLAVIDGFAQEFHRHHVGGVSRNVNVTERDNAFLRSRVALLEAQLAAERRAQIAAAPPPDLGALAPPAFHSPFHGDVLSSDASGPSDAERAPPTAGRGPFVLSEAGPDGTSAARERRLSQWRAKRAAAAAGRTEVQPPPQLMLRPPPLNDWRTFIRN